MATGATLEGHRATRARVQIPKWGCWYADVDLDGEHTLSGSVSLVIADLTLRGTILSGGATKGRSQYRIVAGAGGWGQTVARKSYVNDLGAKHSTVLGDAARDAGETLGTISSTDRVGPGWVRVEGPASAVLELVAPRGWYVDEAGVTQIGARTGSAVSANIPRTKPVDLARGVVVLAPEKIATILPGVTVDGLTAVDVQHEISAKGGLRTTIYGARESGGSSRGLEAFAKLLDVIDPDRNFRGVTEYRVVLRQSKRYDLQPVRRSSGMPDLARVFVRPGVAGCDADVALGSVVLVGFVNSDPSRPYIAGFEDADGEAFVPDVLRLCGGDNFVALANLVADELSDIATALSTHTHAGVTAGLGVTGVPAVPPYTAGSVAASKVKAT